MKIIVYTSNKEIRAFGSLKDGKHIMEVIGDDDLELEIKEEKDKK